MNGGGEKVTVGVHDGARRRCFAAETGAGSLSRELPAAPQLSHAAADEWLADERASRSPTPLEKFVGDAARQKQARTIAEKLVNLLEGGLVVNRAGNVHALCRFIYYHDLYAQVERALGSYLAEIGMEGPAQEAAKNHAGLLESYIASRMDDDVDREQAISLLKEGLKRDSVGFWGHAWSRASKMLLDWSDPEKLLGGALLLAVALDCPPAGGPLLALALGMEVGSAVNAFRRYKSSANGAASDQHFREMGDAPGNVAGMILMAGAFRLVGRLTRGIAQGRGIAEVLEEGSIINTTATEMATPLALPAPRMALPAPRTILPAAAEAGTRPVKVLDALPVRTEEGIVYRVPGNPAPPAADHPALASDPAPAFPQKGAIILYDATGGAPLAPQRSPLFALRPQAIPTIPPYWYAEAHAKSIPPLVPLAAVAGAEMVPASSMPVEISGSAPPPSAQAKMASSAEGKGDGKKPRGSSNQGGSLETIGNAAIVKARNTALDRGIWGRILYGIKWLSEPEVRAQLKEVRENQRLFEEGEAYLARARVSWDKHDIETTRAFANSAITRFESMGDETRALEATIFLYRVNATFAETLEESRGGFAFYRDAPPEVTNRVIGAYQEALKIAARLRVGEAIESSEIGHPNETMTTFTAHSGPGNPVEILRQYARIISVHTRALSDNRHLVNYIPVTSPPSEASAWSYYDSLVAEVLASEETGNFEAAFSSTSGILDTTLKLGLDLEKTGRIRSAAFAYREAAVAAFRTCSQKDAIGPAITAGNEALRSGTHEVAVGHFRTAIHQTGTSPFPNYDGNLYLPLRGVQALQRHGIPITPFHLQVYHAARSVGGQRIAFDLDGTLLDYIGETTATAGEYRLTVQIKPGAEALVLGLAERNQLLLYTVREENQLAAIVSQSSAFQRSFSNSFTFADWIDAMSSILSKALQHPETLSPFEKKVLELVEKYRNVPFSLAHLKHPELARQRGKGDFDVIVDDSEGLGELLQLVGATGLRHLRLMPGGLLEGREAFKRSDNDELLQVAQFLHAPDTPPSVIIEHANPLPTGSARQFSVIIKEPTHLETALQHLHDLRQRWLARK